jgi:hypothetical protein
LNVSGSFNLNSGANLTTSTITQTAGTFTDTGTLLIESLNGNASTYNLGGGTLSVATLNISSGGKFNWTGGTLNLNGSSANSVINLATLTVPAGGVLTGHATIKAATVVSGGGAIMPPPPASSTAQTMTFDDATNAYAYDGLYLAEMKIINGASQGGYAAAGTVSQPNVAISYYDPFYNGPAKLFSYWPFKIVSLDLTQQASGAALTINAYNNSLLVATTVVYPSSTAPTLYTLNYPAATSVTFSPNGTVQFAIDNLTIQNGPGTYLAPVQTFTSGLDFSKGGTYDWQLASTPRDNATGVPGTDFTQLQVTGGNLALGGTSRFNVDFSQLASGDQPGRANNNTFWNSSHIWSILPVYSSATNTGSTNFASITNGTYRTGGFATQLNPDGQSIDLVYNEMNLTAGSANNPVLGKINLSGNNGMPTILSAGNVTLGSVDIAGLAAGSSSLQVQMDVKGTASAINQWYMELSDVQAGGPTGYTIVPAGAAGISVPAGDSAYMFTFTNLPTSADTFINFDWTAGNSGVTLDEIVVPVPEPSSLVFLAIAGPALMVRRRARSIPASPHV